MGVSVDQLTGLLAASRAENFEKKWTDISQARQEYFVINHLMGKGRKNVMGGKSYDYNVAYGRSGRAKSFGFYNTDNPSQSDKITQATVPLRLSGTDFSFDVNEEIFNKPDKVQILNLIEERRHMAMLDLAEYMEDVGWGKPDSSTDKLTPYGVAYWIVKSTGKTDIGDCTFNGGNPSGFSDGAGGIDSDTITSWKNWAGNYASVTKADLIKKMRKAHHDTNFVSPISRSTSYVPESVENRYQIFVNNTTMMSLEDVGEAQNENLGRDLAPYDGQMLFRKNPIMQVPFLADDSTNPVYFINWDAFKIITQADIFMKETVKPSGTQHTVVTKFIDLAWNTICYDRRRLAVLSVG